MLPRNFYFPKFKKKSMIFFLTDRPFHELILTLYLYGNIRTTKVYILVIAYDPDPAKSGALHGQSHAFLDHLEAELSLCWFVSLSVFKIL